MHKFFYNYNNITEKYELAQSRSLMFGKASVQAENTLLPEIRRLLQELYNTLVLIKEAEKNEANLNLVDETELLLSNLFYSLFVTPLDINATATTADLKALYQKAITLAGELEKLINIPEYNRTITIIKSNLQSLFNTI